jgi:DNA-binding transcriptional regulator YdaS (Cro superfamily)
MKHQKPDIIKIAVQAAGGRNVCAERLGVSPWSISNWQAKRSMPANLIRPLCALGGVVTYEQLLDYIEANAAERVAA